MSQSNIYCSLCNYQGDTNTHFKRHLTSKKHTKISQRKQLYGIMRNNLYVGELNLQNIRNLDKFNNDCFKNHNIWMHDNLHDMNIKMLQPISLGGDNIKKILDDPATTEDYEVPKNTMCPWCVEYNNIENYLKNGNKTLIKMPIDDCIEHMKICPYKINHNNIEKNLTLTLQQTLKIISDMNENFKILSTNYDLLKRQNEELLKTNNTLEQANSVITNVTDKINKLKNKYKTLKETNDNKIDELLKDKQTKYDELFKASLLKNCQENSGKKVNLTINGGTNNINLLTYIGDNCKNAEPINAIDNNRKMAMNKLLISKGITESPQITELSSSTETTTTQSIKSTQPRSKIPDINDSTFPKMFIEGYEDNENSYHVFVADILIKYFKKDDISKQPMWSTDTSRCSYIIKILPDDWVKDKSGVTLLDKCIKPFIEYIDDVIRKYSESLDTEEIKIQNKFMEETKKAYIKKFKGKNPERFNFKCIESCMICNEELYNFAANKSLGLDIKNINTQQTRLGEILVCINKEGFSKKVIKEITPYFTSDRLKLNQPLAITDITAKTEDIKSLNNQSTPVNKKQIIKKKI
jgi:hypothetical protein